MNDVPALLGNWIGLILGGLAVLAAFRKMIVEWLRRQLGIPKAGVVENPEQPQPVTMQESIETQFNDFKEFVKGEFDQIKTDVAKVHQLETIIKNGLEARTKEMSGQMTQMIAAVARLEGRMDQQQAS